MLTRKLTTLPALALTTALAVPAMSLAAANWQYTDWDSDGNLEMTSQEFSSGFSEGGTYDAWNRDANDDGLSEGEFATGMFADWDRDNDMRITEDEYDAGAERWYGADYDVSYSDWDADQSGYIEKTEFRGGWDNEYFNAVQTACLFVELLGFLMTNRRVQRRNCGNNSRLASTTAQCDFFQANVLQ
jgi:hypothetical protein